MDDDGGEFESSRGAVWILFLNAFSTDPNDVVQGYNKISDTAGFALDFGDQFGTSLAALGDLDGDTVVDLAVGPWAMMTGGPTVARRGCCSSTRSDF